MARVPYQGEYRLLQEENAMALRMTVYASYRNFSRDLNYKMTNLRDPRWWNKLEGSGSWYFFFWQMGDSHTIHGHRHDLDPRPFSDSLITVTAHQESYFVNPDHCLASILKYCAVHTV